MAGKAGWALGRLFFVLGGADFEGYGVASEAILSEKHLAFSFSMDYNSNKIWGGKAKVPSANNKNRIVAINTATQKNDYSRGAVLFYLLEGRAVFTYDSRRAELERSDILVINRGTEYAFTGTDDFLLASLELADEAFESACDGVRFFVDCNSTTRQSEHFSTLRAILRQMILNQIYVEENEKKYAHLAFSYYSLYYKLLETIVANFVRSYSDSRDSKLAAGKCSERREEIERYVNIHYREPIGLADISNELFISKNTVSKYFSRMFGVTFSQYLKDLRLRHAMNDLLYTSRPITQIAFDNGFSSSSFFNKAFRERFSQSPREVRSRFLQENEVEDGLEDKSSLQERVKKLLDMPDKTISPSLFPPFPSRPGHPIQPCWRALINLGRASELLRADMQAHIKILSRHFTYARFWDPFSEEMLLDINHPGPHYNFLRLDQLFDSLLACGMKPFIAFEPKMERVNEGIGSVIVKAHHSGFLDSLDAWTSIIQAFMRHIVQKYGTEEVSGWKFELTYGVYQLRGMEPSESYLALFESLSEAVHRYAPQLAVGGPALPSGEISTFCGVLAELKNRDCRPGFISAISFAYEINKRTHHYSDRSIDEEYLLQDVKKLRGAIEDCGFHGLPLYITEWNETVADRNFLNDSCYRGAYIVENLLNVYPYVDAIGYFSGTDLRAEYFDSGPLLQGGNGLLSRDGIFKPAGFAFCLMGRLLERYVGSGRQFLITADGRGNYAIIAHNKRKLDYYFYKTPEWEIEKDALARFREDEESVALALELTGVENGKYHIRVHRVNAHYGSVLDLWRELDYSQALSPWDIRYLQRTCEPRLQFSAQRVTDGRLRLEARLEPDEFLLIEASRSQ